MKLSLLKKIILSNEARTVAEKGESSIAQLIVSMNEITLSSKRIEEIISVIDDIAFQTNLLSLNAAVEAARAGEQGKGFAIVADAVRTLANRSAEAAKDIATLIRESSMKAQNGQSQAVESSEIFGNIVKEVKRMTDLIQEISVASKEQAQGLQQINQGVTQLDSGEQLSHQCEVVANLTVELETVVYGARQSKPTSVNEARDLDDVVPMKFKKAG